MAELNPVPNSQVLLESMLQKLRVNAQSDNGSQTQMSVEVNAETDSSAVYQFGFSSNNRREQERHSLNWNNNERTQQSSSFGATSTQISNNPDKKIRKHVFSPKPKRAPLIWKGDNQFPMEKNIIGNSWFRQEGENRDVLHSGLSPSFQTDPYQTPPDLLAQSFPVTDTPEIRGQSGIWTWGAGKDTGKPTKKSKKKWGDAKRWTQKMKERWKERHRATETEPRNDGERQALNEVRNVSSLPVPVDVNNTTTKLEPIDTGMDGAANSSPSYMSENLFSLSTSNLMEEIFSGTQWAQFLSVSSTTQDQPNESLSHINQSGEEKWTGTGHHTDTINSLQMSHPESFTQDVPVYSRNHASPIGVPSSDVANQLQTSVLYRNHLQNPNLSETHNIEQMNEQSQFSHQFSNEHHMMSSQQSYSQSQVSDLNHNQAQPGFIPLLDHSYLKPMDSFSLNSRGSLQRKREHWTNRRDQFKYREDEEYSSSSSSSLSNPQYSEDSESSISVEIAFKKRKMDDSRHVRFAEEVIMLPPAIWPEDDEEEEVVVEEVKEEEKKEEKKEEVWPQDPPSRSSFPKWIVSLKGRRTKYKF
ncbi:uncharacterized protein [Paramisgurnus dabryanus]|uniref:uncharacterized protein n=1 Tax=Paramisgurnus dabryanus TaxID=90735 RepID=UPI0031F413A0